MKKRILAMVSVLILMLTIPAYAVQSRAPAVLPSLSFSGTKATCEVLVSNRQSRQRLDRHGTIVAGSCETFHHYNVQGVK